MTLFNTIDTKTYKAFVYRIDNTKTLESYIGYKQTFTKRMNPKTKTKETKESDYQTYQSSSTLVQSWNTDDITKTILRLCKTVGEAKYFELKYLFEFDVLNPNNKWVNKSIGLRRTWYG